MRSIKKTRNLRKRNIRKPKRINLIGAGAKPNLTEEITVERILKNNPIYESINKNLFVPFVFVFS